MGLGALVGYYVIYYLTEESANLTRMRGSPKSRIARSKLLDSLRRSKIAPFVIPVIAGFIIGSPLPDEWAAVLLGAAKYGKKQFMIHAFSFNVVGIHIIAAIGSVL